MVELKRNIVSSSSAIVTVLIAHCFGDPFSRSRRKLVRGYLSRLNVSLRSVSESGEFAMLDRSMHVSS